MRHLSFLLWILSVAVLSLGFKLKTVYEWKFVDFVWKNPKHKQQAIKSGNYNVNACVLYDVDKALDGRVFVTAVRDKGVPASLMTVTRKMGKGGPLLYPYPNWSWYENNKCNGIIGVYRVYIICNHLFVLDCGKIGDNKICPAQLLIFNLSTDKLVRRVIIPDDVATNQNGTGLLVTPMVHTRHCRNIAFTATVYMADIEGYGLVVWNAQTSKFCRFESNYMKPVDDDTTFTIQNQSFSLNDGILGLTLVRKDLYYAALAGDNIYKINTWALQKCGLNANETDEFTQVAGTLTGQTAPIASKDCAIFFSNIPQTSIMCADTSKEINSNTMEIIADDAEKLQFTSGMKVVAPWKSYLSDLLIILTNRFQRFATNTSNPNEINFRVLSIDLEKVIKYTSCFASCNYESEFFVSWHKDIIYNIW